MSIRSTAEVSRAEPKTGSWWAALWIVVGIPVVGLVASHARTGAVSGRIGNPEVAGAPRPVEYLFGLSDDFWLTFQQIAIAITMVLLIVSLVLAWRRWPAHPVLMMGIVVTTIVWQDPIMNWAPYAVYNPKLWHWPEDWPLVSLSPTVEPFIVFGYVVFYLTPYFPAVWILRRVQTRRPLDSFVWRHPLITLAALILVIGFIFDMFLEVAYIRTGFYIYSQVIPLGSIFTGTPFQFPLLWESLSVTFVMMPVGVLLYRDDTGRTVAERLGQRARVFVNRPALSAFIVMFVIVNASYFVYGAWFTAIKWADAATSVACPWPYPEAKVYDPQGFYEENGQQGPYSVGIWSTWMSGQPDGRPDVQSPADGGRCAPNEQ